MSYNQIIILCIITLASCLGFVKTLFSKSYIAWASFQFVITIVTLILLMAMVILYNHPK